MVPEIVPQILQEVKAISIDNHSLSQTEFCKMLDVSMKRHTDCLLLQNQVLLAVLLQLRSDHSQSLEKVDILLQYQQQKEREAEEKRIRFLKVKARKRQIPRDNITPKQFWYILHKVSGNTYPEIRAFVAFCLSYIWS